MRNFLLAISWSILPVFSQSATAEASPRKVTFPKDLSKWIVTTVPQDGSKRWFAANYSETSWKVTRQGNKVAVSIYDEHEAYSTPAPLPFSTDGTGRGRQFSVRVKDGWIVGSNAGEWGGSLWWCSPRGEKRYLVSKDQVNGFFHTKKGLLAIEGLAHLGIDRGQVIKIHQDALGWWKSSRFVDLGHEPEAATQSRDGSLLIATTDRLLRVHLDKRIEVLQANAFWGGLYPNSLVETPSKDIYVGMRHGVAHLYQRGRTLKVDWLLPNRKFVEAKAEI